MPGKLKMMHLPYSGSESARERLGEHALGEPSQKEEKVVANDTLTYMILYVYNIIYCFY